MGCINAPHQVFVARRGEPELTPTVLTAGQVRDLVEQMLRVSGRRLDLSSPFVDAALPGGERLHVVIPDVTRTHWAVNIRKYVVRASRLDDLVALGSLTPQAARFLSAAVAAGLNILVSGATQAGKPTRRQGTPTLNVRLCHRDAPKAGPGTSLSRRLAPWAQSTVQRSHSPAPNAEPKSRVASSTRGTRGVAPTGSAPPTGSSRRR